LNQSVSETIVNWPTRPETLLFLCSSFGIMVAMVSLSALGKVTRRTHLMSIVAFFVFYFIGPLLHIALQTQAELSHFSRYGVVRFSETIGYFFLSLMASILFMPQNSIILLQGLLRISGISRFNFWLTRRLRVGVLVDLMRLLRSLGATRLAAWSKKRLRPRGGYQRWGVTWGSYVIFFLGAVYTVWFFESGAFH
jgi:hypothetical protein